MSDLQNLEQISSDDTITKADSLNLNSEEVIVQVSGLTKVFLDFWRRPKAKALNQIDLNIKRGQVFGLLGPNGSGKSTTVKLILGLLYPTRGSIKIFGTSPRNVAIKSRIGYLPEETYLYNYLTARETLEFFGSLFNLTREDCNNRVEQLLEMVGLQRNANRRVGEFSKGMARRIGLAQALINDPDLVILDEPTSGLDPIGCREVKDIIRALAARGKTIILSSHLLADVEDICDEIVVLYGGTIRAQGNLKHLLSISDQTQLTMPEISPIVMEKVKKSLMEELSEEDIKIEKPKMNLEQFFLDTVKKARAQMETSGAESGGEVAAYLRGNEEDTANVLAKLTGKIEVVEEVQEPIPEPVEKTEDINKRLAFLAEEEKEEENAELSAEQQKKQDSKELAEANQRLQNLLKKDD